MGDVQQGDRSWIDEMADRFERAWAAGERPRIEAYLGDAAGPRRSRLLEELVRVERELRIAGGETPRAEEFRGRFPGDERSIDAAFEATDRSHAARPSTGAAAAGRNLLLGLLALQNNFIDRNALLAAFAAWVADKGRPLGRILLESGALEADTHALLEALVRKHLAMHGDDPERSLATLSTLGSARDALAAVGDTDLQASLAFVSADRADDDSNATRVQLSGRSAAAGPRFRVLRFHARGGLGQVSVARDEELHRDVALKEIQDRYADDPGSRSRFLVEAEITGNLEHPGIIPVYGLGHYDDGRPFYAMRFIKGDSLKDAIAQYHAGSERGEPILALQKLLRRFLDVCYAMAYAHSRGVLHRDLKPQNILLGPYGETLVVDWGLAKPIGRAEGSAATAEGTWRPESGGGAYATRAGEYLGTPAYMSPEQAAGDLGRLGQASDVYGLGATLYCLLTGRAPFEDRDVDLVLEKVGRGEFAPPRAVIRATDPALEAICLRAMALRPEDRYGSPRALADDLERWLAGEPVSAWREPWTLRARRWAAKHRPLVASATTAMVLALVATAWGWSRAQIEEARENARGASLVQAILAANIEEVSSLVDQLEIYRRWADPALAQVLESKPDDSPESLRAALALLPVDARQADYLSRRLLGANAEEVLVIRDALKPFGQNALGRMSRDPAGWGRATSNQGLYDVGIDRAIKRSGKASVYVTSKYDENNDQAFGNVMQTVNANQFRGKRIRLSAYVKSVKAESGVMLWMRVDGMTSRALSFDNMDNRPIIGSIDWKNYDIVLDIPEGSAVIAFGVWMPGKGQFWVDDVAFEAVGEDVPTTDMGLDATNYSEAMKAQLKDTLESSQKQPRNLGFEEEVGPEFEAISPYLRALEIDHARVDVQSGLLSLLASQDRRAALIAEYREAIRQRPDDASTHFILGIALSSGAQHDEAIHEFREAIRINPDYTAAACIMLAGSLWDKGDYGGMVAILQRAVEREPDGVGLRHRLALAHLFAGDREGYRRVCAATAERFDFAKDLGLAEAIRACLLAPDALEDLSVLPKIAEATGIYHPFQRYILGLAHYRAGQPEQAIRHLNEGMKIEPSWDAHALHWVVLAMAHHRLGHAEEARSWLEKACNTRGNEARGIKPGQIFGPAAMWWDRGDFMLLRREADELILKASRSVP